VYESMEVTVKKRGRAVTVSQRVTSRQRLRMEGPKGRD
jgi:hypothetical protein